ncbi:P22 phage major capsid protein family protein [Streptomyces cacaoi]|uniref:Major capsid protein n=1 Tax=Streptomyces cacaoi TaxID=1898 RepID=A0A4Y3QYV8_STRCI|nr:P22 phage major capsid protein family protein [Streptomyces cacaoi]GEB50441.1 hypothetical protein SCA03_29920 [Streptomyces cacaoi]
MPTATNGIVYTDKLASAALANIEAAVVLSGTVQKHPDSDFTGAAGHVVNIRRPSILNGFQEGIDDGSPAGSRTIKTESLNEQVLPIKLDQHVYSAIDLSDAELSLGVEDFTGQVVMPQTEAIVNRMERVVASAFAEFPEAEAIEIEVDDNDRPANGDYVNAAQQIRFAISQLSARLTAQNVPVAGRYLVLGSTVAGWLMNDPNLTDASAAGSDSALRESVIGKLHGFTLLQDNRVEPLGLYAYHTSAIQLVTRAPVVPAGGVAAGTSSAEGGYALRWIRDYNSSTASERSFLSTYVGVTVLKDATRDKDGKVVVDGQGSPVQSVIRGLRSKLVLTKQAPEQPEKPEDQETFKSGAKSAKK